MARALYQELFDAIDRQDGAGAAIAATTARGTDGTSVSLTEMRPPPAPQIPVPLRMGRDHPSRYRADRNLRSAAKVAIVLGKPLLLTGEPGSGKTQFASFLSWQLGLGPKPLVFETKSTSIARDLFYTYNTLARFHAAQFGRTRAEGAAEPAAPSLDSDYIHYNALGEAILRSRDWQAVSQYLPPDLPIWPAPSRSVVLIDEIDKAPRDFPNDILNELEHLYFRIPEMNNVRIDATPLMMPIVVLTSNSERNLPDPFLRRCVYYNIAFPDDRLVDIVEARLGGDLGWQRGSERLNQALDLFHEIRKLDLDKRPGTGELLDWLLCLHAITETETGGLAGDREALQNSVGTLVKSQNDRVRARRRIEEWMEQWLRA